MLRRTLPLLLLLAAACCASCKSPLQVVTRNTVKVDDSTGPVVAQRVQRLPPVVPWKIAIIDVDGILLNQEAVGFYSEGENAVAVFHEKLDAAAADPYVKALIVRIHSHGGGVTASDILRHELEEYRACTGEPVIACILDVGTGGAYYLATATDHIMAHPTSVVGGLGVILNLYNLQDTMAQFNIFGMPIKAGKKTDLGTPLHALEDDDKKLLQQMADEYHARFRAVVEQTRPLAPGSHDELFDGRVFTGQQALELGLVDSLGYLDDALDLARTMAGVPNAAPYLFHRCDDRARSPFDATPNIPLHATMMPFSLPGLDRSRMPTFLYIWQPEPTMERLGGL